MLCAIQYHLYNLRNVKNTHGGVLLLVKLQASVCNFTESNTLLLVAFHVFEIKQIVLNRPKHHTLPSNPNGDRLQQVVTLIKDIAFTGRITQYSFFLSTKQWYKGFVSFPSSLLLFKFGHYFGDFPKPGSIFYFCFMVLITEISTN